MDRLRSQNLLQLIALFTLFCLPMNSFAQIVSWKVVDGGWCDLIYLPIPPYKTPGQEISPSGKISAQATVNLEVQFATSANSIRTNDPQNEEGYVSLFNGKNLEGWIVQGMEKAGPKIEPDGVMKVGGYDYWAVITKEDFKNFILRFDVKFDPKGNSGILFHTPKKEIYKSCFEIQMADDEGKSDPTKSPGAIFGHVAPTQNAFYPIGEWNQVEIRYQTPKLSVTVNGVNVQNEVDITKIDGLKHKLDQGGIAIQRNDYKKAAYYKNIRIQRLPD